jgi:hypothetical protein
MGLQLLIVGLAAAVAALIVAAGWWSGSHCPRCRASELRRAREGRATRQAARELKVRTV